MLSSRVFPAHRFLPHLHGSFLSVTTMSQKSSLMKTPQCVPRALTSDTRWWLRVMPPNAAVWPRRLGLGKKPRGRGRWLTPTNDTTYELSLHSSWDRFNECSGYLGDFLDYGFMGNVPLINRITSPVCATNAPNQNRAIIIRTGKINCAIQRLFKLRTRAYEKMQAAWRTTGAKPPVSIG